jgi:hypothetical protein
MLIDNEDESLSELDAVEQKKQLPEVAPLSEMPEKYRQKSLEEVVKMHQEAEKLIGKQAQEVGEVRKLADELIKQNLSSKQQPIEQEPDVDFFENPQEAVRKTVDNHPDVLAARQAGQEFKKMQIQQKLAQEHPDFGQIAQDADFVNWVKSSPIRLGCMQKLMVSLITTAQTNCCLPISSCEELRQNRLQMQGKLSASQTLKPQVSM